MFGQDNINKTQIMDRVTENNVAMCVKAPAGILDTSDMYDMEDVSYGSAYIITLNDGTKINFIANKITSFKRLDERNLTCCKFLNLRSSSISSLNVI